MTSAADTASVSPVAPWRPKIAPIIILAVFALGPVLASASGAEGYVLSLLTRVMVLAIAALSLDLIMGYGGLVSFGHAAFLGIGAYAVGIASSHGVEDLLVQVPLALGASALFALVAGSISLRTQGVYFIMITLAFGQMLYFLATSLAPYGGDDGMTLGARSLIGGSKILKSSVALYWLAFLCLAGVYCLCSAIVASRFGRVLRGIRDNDVRMRAIGFDPFRFKLTAYVISGMIAGLAGCLIANQTEFVSPAFMTWQRSGELIFMVVLGGLGSLYGAILGAALFILLEEFLPEILHYTSIFLPAEISSKLAENWRMVFGPLLILIVMFTRGGVIGFFRRGHDV
jgi:branched-chain amino acid transport system permease protein